MLLVIWLFGAAFTGTMLGVIATASDLHIKWTDIATALATIVAALGAVVALILQGMQIRKLQDDERVRRLIRDRVEARTVERLLKRALRLLKTYMVTVPGHNAKWLHDLWIDDWNEFQVDAKEFGLNPESPTAFQNESFCKWVLQQLKSAESELEQRGNTEPDDKWMDHFQFVQQQIEDQLATISEWAAHLDRQLADISNKHRWKRA